MRSPTNVTKRRQPERRGASDIPAGDRRSPLPTFVEPSLALLVDKPPSGPQ
jgi:hypothetical protein